MFQCHTRTVFLLPPSNNDRQGKRHHMTHFPGFSFPSAHNTSIQEGNRQQVQSSDLRHKTFPLDNSNIGTHCENVHQFHRFLLGIQLGEYFLLDSTNQRGMDSHHELQYQQLGNSNPSHKDHNCLLLRFQLCTFLQGMGFLSWSPQWKNGQELLQTDVALRPGQCHWKYNNIRLCKVRKDVDWKSLHSSIPECKEHNQPEFFLL
mmetsp:Transcript_5857/g.22201  ORF Transcript_5857/g.22201 Transcript_5857/m.22201 type:complete len:204 (+) Transcript_5857:9401-10012(+)